MEKRIELWVFPTGNVAVYRGNAFIPTEQLTEEERRFVLDRVCDELSRSRNDLNDLNAETKKFTENLYNETFGNGQGTLDVFDWDDIAVVIENTARHFSQWQKEQKPVWSEEDQRILKGVIGLIDHNQHYCVSNNEMLDWLKSLHERFSLQPDQEWDTRDKTIVSCIVCCLDGQFVSEAVRKQCLRWFNKHRRNFLNRPSWKPSEEQMEALERASTNEYLSAKQFDILVSLYEQLKRLEDGK